METLVLIPQELSLALRPGGARGKEASVSVWTSTEIQRGALLYPFQGTIRIDKLHVYSYVPDHDVRHRFGLFDEVCTSGGVQVRHCNWVRFLRVSENYGPQVNFVCTKVKGEPVYEAVKPVSAHTELVVYYLPERPEELFFVRMRNNLYRQTMDSILEGAYVLTSVDFRKHSIKDTGGRSRKKHEDPPEGMYEEVDDSGRSERDTPLDLSTSLLSRVLLPISPPSGAEDEHKSISGDSLTSSSAGSSNELLDMTPKIQRRPAKSERALLPCEVCGKAFDRPSLLKRHMRTHTGEKPHVCMVCNKGFSTSSSLNTHRRIHSGEKPHQCQHCGKRFTASSNLYYHRMTHIKEKPHKCSLCSKSFPTPGDLKSHMYVHSGSWPYKCHICSRGFSKHTNLKNHLFLHTAKHQRNSARDAT